NETGQSSRLRGGRTSEVDGEVLDPFEVLDVGILQLHDEPLVQMVGLWAKEAPSILLQMHPSVSSVPAKGCRRVLPFHSPHAVYVSGRPGTTRTGSTPTRTTCPTSRTMYSWCDSGTPAEIVRRGGIPLPKSAGQG